MITPGKNTPANVSMKSGSLPRSSISSSVGISAGRFAFILSPSEGGAFWKDSAAGGHYGGTAKCSTYRPLTGFKIPHRKSLQNPEKPWDRFVQQAIFKKNPVDSRTKQEYDEPSKRGIKQSQKVDGWLILGAGTVGSFAGLVGECQFNV